MRAWSRFADWPLRAKMAALLVAASLLPLAIWAYLDLRLDRERLLEGVKSLLEARGDQVVRDLDGFNRGYQGSIGRVARLPAAAAYCGATPQDRASRQAAMLGILSIFPASDTGIRGAALIDSSGHVAVATEAPLVGVDLSDRPNVQIALRGTAVIADLFVSSPASGSVPTVAYLAPVIGVDGQVTCIAALWVRATALWNAVKASNALAGPGSFAVLFDRHGIRIAHTYSDDIVFHPGGKLDPATVDRLVAERRFGARTRELLDDVRAFPDQFERARSPSPDLGVFRGFAPVNQTWNYGVARRFQTVPWTVFYMVPEAGITARIAQAARERVLLAAVIIVAAGLLGLVFAATILRPIRALSNTAASIASGDLAARVQDPGGDELGQLGSSFNTMAEQVQAHAADLQRSRDELDTRVRERTSELELEIAERVRVETALRERDAALHRAHVMSKLAHVITRPDGSFETWSETLPPLIGVAPAQMPHSTREWLGLLHPQDRPTFRNTSISAGITGTRKDVEYRLRRADGEWIHLRQVIEPLPGPTDTEGRTRWFSTLQDVTEQKRAEEELRESESRFRQLAEVRLRLAAIVESTDDAIIGKTLDGRITSWNPGAEKLFGYSAEEAIDLPVLMLVPPERSDEETDILARIRRGESVDHFETVRVRKDGLRVDVSATISPIRDMNGQVVGASKIARDITERKLVQARLKAQLERMQLLDQITTAIGERQDLQSIYQVAIRSVEERLPVDFICVCRHDALDNVLTVIRVGAHSQVLAMELAMDEQSIIGVDQNGLSRCVRGELIHEPDIQAVSSPFSQRLARGGLRSLVLAPLQSESRVFGVMVAARRQPESFSSGDCEFLRQLSAHVALAAQQAELHGALQQAYDDLRQSQQTVMQQERLRALGQMASGIAHDINNAISPVALYTESLLEREPNLSERGRGYLVTIARAIDDVAATVARMREFYRQREPQLALAGVQLNPLVQQVIDLTRARWSDMPQQRGAVIRLELDLASELPDVLGVESEMREALINLVFNAVDAMPEGGVLTLRTSCSRPALDAAETARRRVQVEVADTGVGMDEETRRRCLEPFFTTKGERGTGLGLAMVYGTMQRHGAEIDIDSAVGRGTTMRLSFPIPTVAPTSAAAPTLPQASASRLRILIVDDDPLMLKSLGDTLELDGHVVVAANGGQAGIDAFKTACGSAQAFDVVITDLGMPYVDGRKVALAVKEGAAATPVILLTGWGQRLLAEGDVPLHVDRVLSKPPKLGELRAALAQVVSVGKATGGGVT